jgi:hypothetical protein
LQASSIGWTPLSKITTNFKQQQPNSCSNNQIAGNSQAVKSREAQAGWGGKPMETEDNKPIQEKI